MRVWFGPIWAPFLISRGLIAFSAICASQVVLRPEYIVPFPSIFEWPRLLHSALFVADSGFYLWIAQSGYEHGPFSPERQANWAFFPLYPFSVAALSSALPLSPRWTGIILSNIALLGSMAVLYRIAAQQWGERTANVSVWLLAFFPVSYFLSGFRPEALFLLLTLVSYHECRSGRWWSAGLAGALAAATRPQGVFVIAFLVVEGIRQHGWRWRRLLPAAGASVLTAGGLAAFMAYLWHRTGNPLAFVHIQSAWQQDPVVPGWSLVTYFITPYLVSHGGWDLGVINVPLLLLGLATGAWLCLNKQAGLGLYLLVSVLLILGTDTLQGGGRYLAATFPVYLGGAAWLGRQSSGWRHGTLAVSAGLLTLLSLLVALDIHAAQG